MQRFISKVKRESVDDLFALRQADNVGNGVDPAADDLDELRAQVAAKLESSPVLDRFALAIDGNDIIAKLGLRPKPELGRVLEALVERVIDDPELNEAPTLLLLARNLANANQ